VLATRVKPLYGHQQGAVVSYSGNARSVPRWWWCRQGSFTTGSPRHQRGRDDNEGPQHGMRPAAELCPASIHDSGSAMTKRTCVGTATAAIKRRRAVSEGDDYGPDGASGPAMTGSFIRRRPGISSRTVSVCTLESQRRAFFRCDNGKSSMCPPPEKALWFKLAGLGQRERCS
jgi:hypothetical protein